jgi:hypothetical protein
MRIYTAALAVLAGLCGAPAAAADLSDSDLPTKKPATEEIVAPALPSSWHYEITGYGWGTDLAGQSGVGPFPTSAFFINFLTLLEHFQGGLMTAFVARNDNYIVGLDVILSRIGFGTNFRDPTSALFGDHATLTLTQAIVTAFGGLRIPVGPPNLQLYGTVGARYFYSRSALDLSFPVVGFEPTFALTKNWADPVAGVTAHYVVNDKWFVNFLADMGGLDNSATGQVLGSVGYNWTPSISTTLGYRVLYTYFRDISGPLRDYRYQSWMYGPFAGFKYSF